MVNKVCPSFKSYPKLTEAAAVTALAVASGFLAGIPGIVASLGGYTALKKWGPPLFKATPIAKETVETFDEAKKSAPLPEPKSLVVEEIEEKESVRLNLLQLQEPKGSPPRIEWEGNSCFLSAVMWGFLLNEPTVLREIPLAIGRLMPGRDPITRDELTKCVGKAENKLRSLIELYFLIEDCQGQELIAGAQVNQLRGIIHRVNANFKEIGTQQGDAQEALLILGDLIFEGSHQEQNLCIEKKRRLDEKVHGELMENPEAKQKDWGRVEIPMGKSIQDSLNRTLNSREFYRADSAAKIVVDDFVIETNAPSEIKDFRKWERPPELLVLTVKRYKDLAQSMIAEPGITVGAGHFREREDDVFAYRYELQAAIKQTGMLNSGHYTTNVKREGQWYFCNDLGAKVEPVDAPISADTAYIFVYRKIS